MAAVRRGAMAVTAGHDVRLRAATGADAAAIAQVHVESWRTTYRGLMPEWALDGLAVEQRVPVWQERLRRADPDAFTVVAEEDDGQIVGFVAGGQDRSGATGYAGTVSMLYLVELRQHQGLGRRLMRAAAEWLVERGLASLSLYVQEDNERARRFYEALGGQPVRVEPFDWSASPWLPHVRTPLVTSEVLYGWSDLQPLLRSPRQR